MTTPSKTEFDKKVLRYEGIIKDVSAAHPDWQKIGPYMTVLDATERYAEAAVKDAIWVFAQMFVDVASTGAVGRSDTSHVEIPAEFADLFGQAYEDVLKATGATAAEEIENIYDVLMDIMWESVTVGVFIRPSVSWSASIARGHIFANDVLFRQAAETIYEIKQAAERLGPIDVSLRTLHAAKGDDGEAPAIAHQLVFFTERDGREIPPVWAEIHTALVGTEVTEQIAKYSADSYRQELQDAAGAPAIAEFSNITTDILGAAGGVAGLAMIGLLVAGGVVAFNFLRKDR